MIFEGLNQRVGAFEAVVDSNLGLGKGDFLHVSAGKTYGGVEKMLMAFAASNTHTGRDRHHFALCFDGLLSEKLEKIGAKPMVFGPARRLGIFQRIAAGKKLQKIIREKSPKAVIFHGDWVFDLFAGAAKKRGFKLIKMLHNLGEISHRLFNWLKGFTRPDLVIANSKITATTYLEHHPGANVATVYPPVLIRQGFDRVEERKAVLGKLGLGDGVKLILTAARFEWGKGHDIGLDALTLLDSKINWVWLVAGAPHNRIEEEYYEGFREKVEKKLPADRVVWLGHVDDLEPYYLSADVYCQFNRKPESYGLTFAEAATLGCPVLTTGIGAAQEVLAGEEGHTFVPEPSPIKFARELSRVLV